jgi:hypothetical protein
MNHISLVLPAMSVASLFCKVEDLGDDLGESKQMRNPLSLATSQRFAQFRRGAYPRRHDDVDDDGWCSGGNRPTIGLDPAGTRTW